MFHWNIRLLSLTILFLSQNVWAEDWICFDATSHLVTKRISGDCFKIGLCSGLNNTGLQSNCFEATQTQYDKASQKYVKIENNDVVDMTLAEKTAIDQAEATAQKQADSITVDNFDITAKDAFVAWLKVYNAKVPSQYRVTKQELIDQIKSDKGLIP